MTKTERCAVFAAIICGFSLTAGITDMMVSESNAISWRASTAGAQSMYGPVAPIQNFEAPQQPTYTPSNSDIFACVQHGKKWQIVDGNVAGPVSAPLFDTRKSCMKQVSDWSKS